MPRVAAYILPSGSAANAASSGIHTTFRLCSQYILPSVSAANTASSGIPRVASRLQAILAATELLRGGPRLSTSGYRVKRAFEASQQPAARLRVAMRGIRSLAAMRGFAYLSAMRGIRSLASYSKPLSKPLSSFAAPRVDSTYF